MDLKLIQNIMEEVRENKDLLDSFSPNQFKSKLTLINHINNLNILTSNSEIVIFGSWYGSILIPAFYDKVKKITCIDMDAKVISKAKYIPASPKNLLSLYKFLSSFIELKTIFKNCANIT